MTNVNTTLAIIFGLFIRVGELTSMLIFQAFILGNIL